MYFVIFFLNKKEFDGFRKRIVLIVCLNGVGSLVILYVEFINLFFDLYFILMLELVGLENISEFVDIVFIINYNVEGLKIDVLVIKVSFVMIIKEKYKIICEVYI